MKKALLLVLMSTIYTLSASAGAPRVADGDLAMITDSIPSCRAINLREAPIHLKCLTSKGAIYERVSRDNFGEAWKSPRGVIWSDRVGLSSYFFARNVCAKIGAELPSREHFELGEAEGFREVLPNMIAPPFEQVGVKLYSYWSSTNGTSGAYIFYSNSGNIWEYFADYEGSVRCIER